MEKEEDEGNSTSEIDITEEMVEAGLAEYALFDSQDPGEHVVRAIYNAMQLASYLRSGRGIP